MTNLNDIFNRIYKIIIIFTSSNNNEKTKAMTTNEIQIAIAKGKVVTISGYGMVTMFEVSDLTIKLKTAMGSFHRFNVKALDYFLTHSKIN